MKAHHASLSPPKPERKVHIIKTHNFLSKSYLVVWCKRLDAKDLIILRWTIV